MGKTSFSVTADKHVMHLVGDRVEDYVNACTPDFELGDYDTYEEAVEAAQDDIASGFGRAEAHKHDDDIGAVSHTVIKVTGFVFDEERDEWDIRDKYGNPVDDDAPVFIHDTLDDRPELKEAFDRAVRSYYRFLDYEEDYYCDLFDYLLD